MSKKFKLTLVPSDKVVLVEEGKNLLQALREQDIYIKSGCGGHASCTDCVIKVVSGEDNLTPPPFAELKVLGNVFHITKERLACQTMLTGDATIDTSNHDKASDSVKLAAKSSKFNKKKLATRVRKEEDVKNLRAEKEKEKSAYLAEKNQNADTWKKHWDKESDNKAPKKLAGGKRPKFFDTDKVDYEKKDFTRPLSAEKQKLKDERLERAKNAETSENLPTKDFKKFRE